MQKVKPNKPFQNQFGLSEKELALLKKLDTPRKVQDFLETIPINFAPRTCMSPRKVLRTRRAHCLEGAFLAALIFWIHREPPFLLDLVTADPDVDHVVALFRRRGKWGAVSKTNHAVLRYREPVYRTVRELALSYFHEYFLDNGKKTLRKFSDPFDIRKYAEPHWAVDEKNLWYLEGALDRSPHHAIFSSANARELRPADPVEIAAGKLTVWRRKRG